MTVKETDIDPPEEGKTGGQMPPYTAFQSIKSALAVLKEHKIPQRIDRSVWGTKFSGSVVTQVLTALRFLGLINQAGVPTPQMTRLVDAYDTEEWPLVLEKVLHDSYKPVFDLDLTTATSSQFNERFRTAYGAEGETGRKCITFFLNGAREAKVAVSPYLMTGAKPRSSSPTRRKSKPRKETDESANVSGFQPPPAAARPPAAMTDRLLDKFPPFDPKWPDDIKAKWFAGFDRLMDSAGSKKDGGA